MDQLQNNAGQIDTYHDIMHYNIIDKQGEKSVL